MFSLQRHLGVQQTFNLSVAVHPSLLKNNQDLTCSGAVLVTRFQIAVFIFLDKQSN